MKPLRDRAGTLIFPGITPLTNPLAGARLVEGGGC